MAVPFDVILAEVSTMAARRASYTTLKSGTPDRAEATSGQGDVALPQSLPKEPRSLSFDNADRSSIRRLSQMVPMPRHEGDELGPDDLPDDDVDTLAFRRSEPAAAPSLDHDAPSQSAPSQSAPSQSAPSQDLPSLRFAPPLPIPPREAIEHPTGTRPRAVAPRATDFSRPQTLHTPVLPRRRRFPWGGIALLVVAALIGAAIGWWATPYVYAHLAPASAAP
jgi:hypothetical protein